MSFSIDKSINKDEGTDLQSIPDSSTINTTYKPQDSQNRIDQPNHLTVQDIFNNSSENGNDNTSNQFSSKTSSNSESNFYYDNSRSSKENSSLREKLNFDEEEDSTLSGQLQLRSTSFRDIKTMLPRGFGAMQNATQFNKEETPMNAKCIKLIGVQTSKSSLSALEEMRQRNQERWKLLGYNPNRGKGDMKGSSTLGTFNPSSIMKQHQIFPNNNNTQTGNGNQGSSMNNGNNLIGNLINEMSKVPQSHSCYARTPHKKMTRVNSSDDPLNLIKTISYCPSDQSDDDNGSTLFGTSATISSSEFRDTELLNPEGPNMPFVMDTSALLAPMDHGIDEIYSSVDRQWSQILKSSQSQIPTRNYSTLHNDKANQLVSKENLTSYQLLMGGQTNLDEDEYEYVIEEEEEEEESNEPLNQDHQNDQNHDHHHDSKGGNNNNKRNDRLKSNNLPSTNNKMNRRKSDASFDYKPYDDPDFNWKCASKNLPIGLQNGSKKSNAVTIKFSPICIVRRALCGESIIKYPPEVINHVIADLRNILEECIALDMIDECTYLNDILQNIKNGVEAVNYFETNNGTTSDKLQEKLDEVNLSLENRKKQWDAKIRILESEKELHLQELSLKFDDECQQLDKLWQSNKMKSKFNKPSPTLLNMRQQVKIQLASHKFNDASKLAIEMQERDRSETETAANRMNAAYKEASDSLKKKFDADKKSINDSYQAKLSSLIKKEEEDLRPFISRKIKYQNLIEERKQASRRQNSTSRNKEMKLKLAQQKIVTRASVGPIQTNAKLKLPPLSTPISKPSSPYLAKRANTSMMKSRVNH